MEFIRTMSNGTAYSFVVHDVSVAADESDIKKELTERYNGVTSVTRLFYKKREDAENPRFNNNDEGPMTRVQVDFAESDDAQRISRDRQIILGGFCRSVRTIRQPFYRPSQPKKSNEQRPTMQTREPLTEQDLINMFAQQRR